MGRFLEETMSNITDYLVEKSQGFLTISPEPSDKRYSMFNTGSVEVETAEFLYAWVKLTKPDYILETGTHYGISALYMGQALQENKNGTILSVETDHIYLAEARQLWGIVVLLGNPIGSQQISSLEMKSPQPYDLIFLDTEPDIRFKEALKFYPDLKPGGYMFIHDLHRHLSQEPNDEHGFGWPFGAIPDLLRRLLVEDALRAFHFATPRGLTGFYKPAEGDFHA